MEGEMGEKGSTPDAPATASPALHRSGRFVGGAVIGKLGEKAEGWVKAVKKTGEDDPRRIIHSAKVGLALSLVSLVYYVNPLYDGFGVSAMWAVLTVVVVMEYTVGGTLGRGLNRAFGTLLAGALGIGAHHLAVLCGTNGEPIILGLLVFLLAGMATFTRFIPEVKARYDYGAMIFILTFSLVAVSSYRVEELVGLAHQRLSTIAIGGATCICTSLFVFPVWAGEELHKLATDNLDKLATYLQGLADEYFGKEDLDSALAKDRPFSQAYKSVLNSKTAEESLANFARWEPAHGSFRFNHPWNRYLGVGSHVRRCACYMEALSIQIAKLPSPQTSSSSELHRKIRDACLVLCSESGGALRELAACMKARTRPSVAHDRMTASAGAAIEGLKASAMESDAVGHVLRSASVLNLLGEIVSCTSTISVAVDELARLAEFRRTGAAAAAVENPHLPVVSIDKQADSHVITVR